MSHVNQIDLIRVITRHLERRWPKGVNPRQFNAVIAAADLIVAAFAEEHRPTTPGMGLVAWLKSDETGLSSLAMACTLAPLAGLDARGLVMPSHHADDYPHPLDPDDFGRVVGLLTAVPELRPHLAAMAGASPQWAALIGHWEELEALYREEYPIGNAPRLYDRMRALCKAARTETGTGTSTEGERS